MPEIDIEIAEVGLRDGLQNAATTMATADKLAWIEAEARAGVREIEVGSFVPPKLIPQMADTAEVAAGALKIKGLVVAVLVPNLKGAERAIKAGAHKITMPISVSRSHSMANVRMTPEEAVKELARVMALRDSLDAADRPAVEAGLSTAFGCTIEGSVSEDAVVKLAAAVAGAGADAMSLSDTVGYANPEQVKRLFGRVRGEVGHKLQSVHLHNTRGLGLANALAAIEAGATALDSSLGGLGGCPFAPGASGNIVTEDLVFMLEAMGLKTGIDLEGLVACREIVARALPEEPLYGYLSEAGIPKGFAAA